jgi:hypothetical protein
MPRVYNDFCHYSPAVASSLREEEDGAERRNLRLIGLSNAEIDHAFKARPQRNEAPPSGGISLADWGVVVEKKESPAASEPQPKKRQRVKR